MHKIHKIQGYNAVDAVLSLNHVWLFHNAMDWTPPGSSVYRISQARMLLQHKQYNQYFIITLHVVYSLKILNHYVVYLKLTLL